MKTMLLAIASMTLGTVLGFLVCRATARRLRRTTHGQRTAQKARDAPKKMGVMGWIKTNKDKAAEAARTSGSGHKATPEEPPTDRPEPPDVGI